MSEREDDTPETGACERRAPVPPGYYDDDATGYEVYAPDDDEDEEAGREDVSPA